MENKKDKIATILIVTFSFIFSLTMLGSGWVSSKGLRLMGVNASDGIWNLALISELRHHFPPDHPGFAGQPLKAYHFLYHLLLAVVSKITFISVINLYFHIFPLIISFLWGWGVYLVVKEWFQDKQTALWSVFFSFFGGSFAFVLPLLGQKHLSIDSGFGIAQPFGSSLVNPAFASSVVLVIWAFYALLKYLKTKNKKWAVLLILLSGLSMGFKAYAGIILMGSLLVISLWRTIFERKSDLLLCYLVTLLLCLLVFLPFNANYGFLVWAPLWPLHRVMQGPLNFTRWDELWLQYQSYMDYLGLLKLEIWAFLLFFFGNLGTRILAAPIILSTSLVVLRSKLRPKNLLRDPSSRSVGTQDDKFRCFILYYLTSLAISFFIPMFFLQPTGGGFNIIQIYWYFLFLISLLVGPGIKLITQKIKGKAARIGFYLVVLALTIPTSVSVFKETAFAKGSFVEPERLEMFRFLKNYKDYNTTMLEIPTLEKYNFQNLEQWFWHYSNVAVPAFGGKRFYIANEVVSFPYEDRERRLKMIENFMQPQVLCDEKGWETEECQKALENSHKILQKEKIFMILTTKETLWFEGWDKVRLIFANPKGRIYEVLPLR